MLRLMLLVLMTFALTVAGCKPPSETNAAPMEKDDHQKAHAGGGGHAHEGDAGHADEVVLTSHAIEQYGVKIDAAQLWQLRPTIVVPARVGFNTEAMAHVGSRLPGRVVELKVRLGSDVKSGDPLLVVESPELGAAQSDFLIKRTAADSAGPAVDLAKASWDRARYLYETTQGVTLTEVQQREAEYKTAVAALRSAQAQAVAAENQLHLLGMTQELVEALAESGEVNPHLTIFAPIAGQVVQREVTLGELVSPEREALLVLADMSTLWMLAEVPEARLPELMLGTTVWVNAGGLDVHRHEGEISYIAPAVDPRTRTATVRAAVRCEGGTLRPGMFVQAEIVSNDRSNPDPQPAIAVPEEAIQIVEGGPAVFVPVIGQENTFARRALTIGKPVGGLVPVYSGLVEGERFVTAGSFILKAELGKSTAEHSH